ncbi:putative cytochrome P450 [Bombardia bombarda]|uniref:Cytochrome P450 n=1 Tax=Bombardia bombarda TaxID=252184 RepID=A0AA39X0I1_9PEZI|nr:putative cytochrome P450 [Bombardia bombarda]
MMMGLPNTSYAGLAGIAVLAGFVSFIIQCIYNLYFHPLAKYPGPFLHRATRLAFVWKLVRGYLPKAVLPMHAKYGRIDIYGHRPGVGPDNEVPKAPVFYKMGSMPPSIVSENHANHSLLRKQMAHGFSDRAMRDQEPIVMSYVDLLIRRLREHCLDPDSKDVETGLQARRPLDMTAWYNWTTFDIIGDLAFGEPFGCLDKAKYDPWVASINGTLKNTGYLLAVKHLRLQGFLVPLLLKSPARQEHAKRTQAKLQRRMELTVERPDLIEGLLKNKDAWNLDIGRIQMNASTLIIAGSETTATLLTGLTFLLLQNPGALKRLTQEVRTAFKSDEDITFASVTTLHYMLACINEGLRRYSPVPIGMPREAPKGGVTVAGEFVPEGTMVAVWQWATHHSEENWTDPFGFHPERFLHDPKFASDRLDSLQPFSVGPRNCIGKNLAIVEMRLILAKIIFHFDMELVNKNFDFMDQRTHILWEKPDLPIYLTPVVR